MKNAIIIIFTLILVMGLWSCGGSTSDGAGDENGEQDLTPILTSISPSSKAAHMPSFTLKATGSKFVSSSKIVFAGVEKDTTYISSTEVTCQIDTDDTTRVSNLITVLVRNPASQGGDSNSLNFTILSNPTFAAYKKIPNTSNNSKSSAAAIEIAGNMNVVWREYTTLYFDISFVETYEIFFCRSTDDCANWSQPVNISHNWFDASGHSIGVDSSGNIYVVWRVSSVIYFSRSTDGGTTWSPAVNISNETDYGSAIAVDNAGNINVVWGIYDGRRKIYFSRSTDSGVNWSEGINISSPYSSYEPKIAVDNTGNIYVIWKECIFDEWYLYFSNSIDNGATWSQPINISITSGAYSPDIVVVIAGSINVVWRDFTYKDIYFRRSTDNGTTWSQPVNISNTSGDSNSPSITMDSVGNINVAWYESSNVYFLRSIDNGATWSQPVNVTNITDGAAGHPSIVVDIAGNITIFWRGFPSGNLGIYLSASTR